MFDYGDLHDLLSSRGGGWDSGQLINIGVRGAIGWDDWLIVHVVVFLFFSFLLLVSVQVGGSDTVQVQATAGTPVDTRPDDPSHAADTLCLTTRRVVDARRRECLSGWCVWVWDMCVALRACSDIATMVGVVSPLNVHADKSETFEINKKYRHVYFMYISAPSALAWACLFVN